MSVNRSLIEASVSSPGALAKRARAAVSNHKDLLPGLDGRSASARRFRDLVLSYISDSGGIENCSEVRLGLIRRLASTTVAAELLEARMVNGESVDLNKLCTLASTTVRLATRLGIERQPKPVESLASILARMEPEGELEPKQPAG